ncbi:MAG: phosphopantetheine-binding protein, partial [Elusimicrobiales bacterium]
TQAVHVAESWIRAGKCKRVVVIAADDITNELMQEWTMPGFLASGTATTKEIVEEAALPFDRRRHGLIVGSGAVALVIEDETEVRKRGVMPLARLLLTEARNSAYHITRLDTEDVAEVMDKFIGKVEKIYGLKRSEIASKTLFVSHETYTPRKGGSASAEVNALKKAFKEHACEVVVSNVKGFTGHTMGASIEDAIAVRALNTGIIPPIANYKEPDPELEGINLSKGGKYELKYAIRFAAGFGSHIGISFIEKIWDASEKRVFDQNRYYQWLKQISGYDKPELEVVKKTLRIKDQAPAEKQESEIDKTSQQALEVEIKDIKADKLAVKGLDENEVLDTIIRIISEKTGYARDMLDPDLDMEADLGIDTVKQAELFGLIREHYGIARKEGLSLKDYPTIRHCVKFVMENAGKSDVSVDSATKQDVDVRSELAVSEGVKKEDRFEEAVKADKLAVKGLDENEVLDTIIRIISE